MREDLLKAASLLREAADKLRELDSPEKKAYEVASTMRDKGLLQSTEYERYASYLRNNPDKIEMVKESIDTLPMKSAAIGEVSTATNPDSRDAFDKFLYS